MDQENRIGSAGMLKSIMRLMCLFAMFVFVNDMAGILFGESPGAEIVYDLLHLLQYASVLIFLVRHKVGLRDLLTGGRKVSLKFMAAALLMGLHRAFGIAAFGLILGLLMGYQINIDNNDEGFTQEKVEKIVRNAADNVKKTVNGISREINTAVEEGKKKAEAAKAAAPAAEPVKTETVKAETVKAEPVKDMNAEILQEMDRQLNGPDVPTIQVPLRSESTDGNVEVVEEGNGYHTATIG